ncbi:MAG: IS256 family transposase [SAR324 cluster bacterium]|uniref:Mutator family transposase n=1 Tax=SAR324 cluster bacterium TaxID=2024889 RepID=A0A7X9FS16_9DELT|nr:IS256 family transposase [SAR324 cluster bacterium]
MKIENSRQHTLSRLSKILDEEIESFKNRPLNQIPYVILDARYERVRHKGCVRDVAVLVATGINLQGKREVLGFSVSLSEAEVHWREFLQSLTKRGLHGVEYIVSDDHEGLKAARKAVFPNVVWQRCQFHFAQNAQSYSPKRALKKPIAEAVRDIFNCPSVDDALSMKEKVIKKFEDSAPLFVKWLDINIEECFSVYSLPRSFHVKLRTVNSLENLNREIKRRTFLASIFPNEQACSRLVGAILMEIHETWISDPLHYLYMPDREELIKNNKIYRRNVA